MVWLPLSDRASLAGWGWSSVWDDYAAALGITLDAEQADHYTYVQNVAVNLTDSLTPESYGEHCGLPRSGRLKTIGGIDVSGAGHLFIQAVIMVTASCFQ